MPLARTAVFPVNALWMDKYDSARQACCATGQISRNMGRRTVCSDGSGVIVSVPALVVGSLFSAFGTGNCTEYGLCDENLGAMDEPRP